MPLLTVIKLAVLLGAALSSPKRTSEVDPSVREVRSTIFAGDMYRVILGTADRNAYIALERIALIDNRVVAERRWQELPVDDNKLPAIAITSIDSIVVDSERQMRLRLGTDRSEVDCQVVLTHQTFHRPECSRR